MTNESFDFESPTEANTLSPKSALNASGLIRNLIAVALLFGSPPANADISFVEDSTETFASNATSFEPTEPTGTAEDDLVLAFCSTEATDGAWTDPADFTQVTQKAETTGLQDAELYVGYKVRGSTAGSGYQFDYSGSAAHGRCTLTTWRGIDGASPLDVTYVEANHYGAADNAPNTAARAITTISDDSEVVLLYQASRYIGTSTGAPSGYTVRADYAQLTSAVDNGRTHYIVSKSVASAGTETPGAYTHNDTNGGVADSRTVTLALRAGSSGPSLVDVDIIPTRFYNFSFTPSRSTTIYAVAVPENSAAPSATQIRQGLNASGEAASGAASKEVEGADTLTVPVRNADGEYDVWAVLVNLSGETFIYSEVTAVE